MDKISCESRPTIISTRGGAGGVLPESPLHRHRKSGLDLMSQMSAVHRLLNQLYPEIVCPFFSQMLSLLGNFLLMSSYLHRTTTS